MQMKDGETCARARRSISQRLIAGLLLVCHLVSATAILPCLVLVLDGRHSVSLQYGEGGVGVRLHHPVGDGAPHSCDNRTLPGRAVVFLCCGATEGDHVLAALDSSQNTALKKTRVVDRQTDGDHTVIATVEIPRGILAVPSSVRWFSSKNSRNFALDSRHRAIASVRLLL